MKVYVVIGTSGEYSDREEHVVCAYVVERMAQKHVLKATEWRQQNDNKDGYSIEGPSNPFDPRCHGNNGYYQVDWTVVEVELRVELPA